MSRIIGLTLLFIVLVDNFYDNAVLSAGLHVTKVHIRKCRCRVSKTGKMKCRLPLLPTTQTEKKDLINCLCNKANQHKFPEFQEACGSRHFSYIIPMV
ncbi:hypothetical protein PAMP_015538 [Pampus punctatissimus]